MCGQDLTCWKKDGSTHKHIYLNKKILLLCKNIKTLDLVPTRV
jgi:hypothetical protein